MKYDSGKRHRTSIRLQGHDYSQGGAYFITLVAFNREALFGEILNGEIKLSRCGEIVREEWFASTKIRKEIRLEPDEFVVMPNHVHGIVWIENESIVGAKGPSPLRHMQPRSLGSFVAGFKSSVTKRIRDELNQTSVWQRNYYDRIIRNDRELIVIQNYIWANPLNWDEDSENPKIR